MDIRVVIIWGIVPTNFKPFEQENIDALERRLIDLLEILSTKGIGRNFQLPKSLISPSTCCLANPDGEKPVEKAFKAVNSLSARLR